jgi:hypothetical protein
MPNGTLKLYNKLTNALLVSLDILGTFNIEDNLNETPSNMKVKVITSNTYREEFQVNTVAYHEDTNSWWVIKSDESSYLTTGEYEHEIQLIEYLEFYAYRHLPNCAFSPNTYDLEDMLNRLFDIAKLSITVVYPNFLDKDKIMPFFSFENFTVANAIKNIGRAINAIPKMSINPTGFVPTLTFINRNGIDATIKDGLNNEFPIAYEKNMNSSDQFTTRSVSNITNAKSSSLVVAPKSGGFKMITPNAIEYNPENAIVFLPSKIDKVEFVRVFPKVVVELFSVISGTVTITPLFTGYYTDANIIKQKAIDNASAFDLYTLTELQQMVLPSAEQLSQINLNDVLSTSSQVSLFKGLFTIKSKFDFDTPTLQASPFNSIESIQNKTIHWRPFTNELIMSKNFREGLAVGASPEQFRFNLTINQKVVTGTGTETIRVRIFTEGSGYFGSKVPVNTTLIQVGYFPIADIKVSIDNDNDAQDEKFFNQSGKVIDAVSVSKLITSHTNDSVEGTKIRNARYTSLASLLPLGQLVRDNNQLYVITQRSIDGVVKNSNEYYNVIYTLSRNRIGRSENIVADSSVISYKTPDDNLVFRSQLYKDYIELSLVNANQVPNTPYLPMTKALVLSSTLAGTNFDFTVLAKNSFGTTPTIVRYVKNPIIFDLHKSKLMNINWQDNNELGFRLDVVGGDFFQTPIVYTDNLGKATNFELLFLDTNNLETAKNSFNGDFSGKADDLIPFTDLTRVDIDYYTTSVLANGRFSIRIQEDTSGGRPYKKDPFEIPVFEYMIQGNDDYNPLGNIVIGNDLFTTFTDTNIRYFYVLMGGDTGRPNTRFTAENAIKLIQDYAPTTLDQNRVSITRDFAHILDLDLFSNLATNTRNNTTFTNIGIFAVIGTTNAKFLFAINDYVVSGINDNSNIRVFINNWKI